MHTEATMHEVLDQIYPATAVLPVNMPAEIPAQNFESLDYSSES